VEERVTTAAEPQAFGEWLARRGTSAPRPWLLLGKGPSFDKHRGVDLTAFDTLALNHAARELPVTAAHVIDLEVLDQCGPALERNAGVLVMPWVPHARNESIARLVTGHPARLSDEHLGTLATRHPLLRRLCEQGRLLWYNLATAPQPRPGGPVIPVRYFSAEAALNLLAVSGVRTVRSLGLDGGRAYGSAFDDLSSRTLLANGRSSFDAQFEEFARTRLRTGISYAPLDVESPIRVYVAATEVQRLAVRVLEYSIHRHASMDVEVRSIGQSGLAIPLPRNPAHRPRTPFSFQRFLIPALAGFRGRAVYLDSDMLVFRDIMRLWTLPMKGADVLAVRADCGAARRPQFSVMLLDCERLRWDIDEIVARLDAGTLDYESLMYRMSIAGRVRDDIPPCWNALERFDAAETALLHYTDMPTQPWLSAANPLGILWVRALLEAIDQGWISRDEVAADVAAGHVRPSLLHQVDHRLEDSLLLPDPAVRSDRSFVPTWTRLSPSVPPWRRRARALRTLARRLTEATGLDRAGRRVKDRIVR
jgi:hypothetical protein